MASIIIQPTGRGGGKKILIDALKQSLESGILTYKDEEPIEVHMTQPFVEPSSRNGLIEGIKDKMIGIRINKRVILDTRLQSQLMKNLKDLSRQMRAFAVTAGEIKLATERMTTIARGHCIRNADGTVTDVSNDPRYKCNDLKE